MALIECPECKADVSDRAPSCPQCGFPLASSSSATAATVEASTAVSSPGTSSATAPRTPRAKPGRRLWLALVVGGAVLVLGVAAFVYLSHPRRTCEEAAKNVERLNANSELRFFDSGVLGKSVIENCETFSQRKVNCLAEAKSLDELLACRAR